MASASTGGASASGGAALRGSLRRVLVIAGDLGLGGAEKQLVALIGALSRAGIAVDVHVFSEGHHYDDSARLAGATLHSGPLAPDPARRSVHLARLARRLRPDLVLSWRFYLNPYAAAAARACGVAGLGAMREDFDDACAGVGRLAGVCLRAPAAIVTNSTRAARALSERRVRAAVLANVIDLDAFDSGTRVLLEPAAVPFGERPVLLAVGTLKQEKRFDVLLDAFAHVLLAHGDAWARSGRPFLAIAGDGPLRGALAARLATLGLGSDDAVLLGSRNDVPALLSSAALHVLSSDQEGTPNVILEAMAASRAVVTTDTGDAAVLVEHARTGLVVPTADSRALAAAIAALLADHERRDAMGRAGRDKVQAYAANGLAERAIDLFAPYVRHERSADVRHRRSH